MNEVTKPKTQGHIKMLRYISDLIRNKNFRKLLKKLRKIRNKHKEPKGMYSDWTKEEQEKHDYINKEAGAIIDEYEKLRKRTNKLLVDKDFRIRETIASYYGLDNNLISLALSMYENKYEKAEFNGIIDDPDMCQVIDIYDEEMSPFNKGEEIIYLRPDRQLFLTAYPVAVAIHPRASKRDVIDFVEKQWKMIDSMVRQSDKRGVLKVRRRKYDQKMIDFIWELRTLPAKNLKVRLDREFSKNGLAYYEISKIIHIEKKRRYKDLTLT